MLDKHYVGLDLTKFEDNGKLRPISRVTLFLDSKNYVTAGDNTGYELKAECPHATQAMANALLGKFKGYQYQQYEAGSAKIDPLAELGDGITAGGIYSVISKIANAYDKYQDVQAPGEEEMEDEYPSDQGPMTKELQRQLVQNRSEIAKTAEEIKLSVDSLRENVGGDIDTLHSEIKQTADSITSTVSATYATKQSVTDGDAATLKSAQSQISQTATSITNTVSATYATKKERSDGDASTLSTARSEIKQTAESIKLTVTNGASGSTFTLKAGETTLSSGTITFTGLVNFVSKGNLATAGGTTINGSNITTGTLNASLIKAGILQSNDGKTFYLDLEKGVCNINGSFTSTMGTNNDQVEIANGEVNILTDVAHGHHRYVHIYGQPLRQGVELGYDGNLYTGLYGDFNYAGIAFSNGAKVYAYLGNAGSQQVNQNLEFAASNETDYVMALGVRDGIWTLCPKYSGYISLGSSEHKWADVYASGTISCNALSAWGSKDRIVPTAYGVLGIAAMESPKPVFSDFGGGVCDDDGTCYIVLDERYQAVTQAGSTRRWVLTDTDGSGALWAQNTSYGAVVRGAPGQTFDWLCLAAQKGAGGEYAEVRDTKPPWQDPDAPAILTDTLESVQREDTYIESILYKEETA